MDNVGIYRTKKFTAYIYPRNIVICTKYQAFRISYLTRSHKCLLDDLSIAIMRGRIKTLADLQTFNGVLVWENCSQPKYHQLEMRL